MIKSKQYKNLVFSPTNGRKVGSVISCYMYYMGITFSLKLDMGSNERGLQKGGGSSSSSPS
jgi:hypothetical protein